jgi:hypothetical protein
MRRNPFSTATLAVLVVMGGLAGRSVAQEGSAQRAEQLKAGYLFNFVKFVEWPASTPADILTVCFVGGDGVQTALADGIETKRVGGRRLVVRQLPESATAENCNVLYLDAALTAQRTPPASVGESPILTVSDANAFVQHGGIIELFTDSNRLRFHVNVGNAQKAGLRISSSLLQLAATVERVSTK